MSELTFLASIAPLQGAIKIAHDSGGRVVLDIPESEMPALVRMVLYRGKVLRVTIADETTLTELDDAPKEESKRNPATVDLRRAAKRRN